jgi:pantetheine-phosphate adenylyltransferase
MPATDTPRVLYPGSFDPVHLGHVDVIEQALELFGDVVVAVMHNHEKPSGLFSVDERLELCESSLSHLGAPSGGGVRVVAHTGLAIQAASAERCAFIVKGLRTAADFEIEQQMAHNNHAASGIRTVYVPCRPDRAFVSSRFVREIAQYGGEVGHLVPAPVAAALHARFPAGDG